MANSSQHEVLFTLDVAEFPDNKPMVLAVVRKPKSDEGATDTYPYAVWVAQNEDELKDPTKRRSPASSVESQVNVIRMFFQGKATYSLASGQQFTLEELLDCEDDAALTNLIASKKL
jgi:hypothetical protein